MEVLPYLLRFPFFCNRYSLAEITGNCMMEDVLEGILIEAIEGDFRIEGGATNKKRGDKLIKLHAILNFSYSNTGTHTEISNEKKKKKKKAADKISLSLYLEGVCVLGMEGVTRNNKKKEKLRVKKKKGLLLIFFFSFGY